MTESELVERCRRGDRQAQREFYARTSERIYRLLLRMTGNPDDAFDLAQDTYLRAFDRIAQFDGRSSPATWLYRVATTEALQFLRRARTVRVQSQTDAVGPQIDSAENQSMTRLDLEAALSVLKPTDRAMLLLRYQEGLGYRAIAKIVGCAEGTVASRLNRARARLRELLGDSYAPREGTEAVEHPKDRVPGREGLRPPWTPAG